MRIFHYKIILVLSEFHTETWKPIRGAFFHGVPCSGIGTSNNKFLHIIRPLSRRAAPCAANRILDQVVNMFLIVPGQRIEMPSFWE